MPSCSARRKHHKRLARFDQLPTTALREREATRLLQAWRREARRRARSLGAPAVWALADSATVRAVGQRVDPSGALLVELRRVCAESVAEVAGRHLVRGSRPVADRRRRLQTGK
jgi:hypothetical protein